MSLMGMFPKESKLLFKKLYTQAYCNIVHAKELMDWA